MPAMMPMIAMTIRSSMSVKPFSSRISPVLVIRLAVQRRGDDREDGDGHHQLHERDASITTPADVPHGLSSRLPRHWMLTVIPCLSNGRRWADGSRTEMSVKLSAVVPDFFATNVISMRTPWPLTPGLLPSRDNPTMTSFPPAPSVARTKGCAPSCDRNGEVRPVVARSRYCASNWSGNGTLPTVLAERMV